MDSWTKGIKNPSHPSHYPSHELGYLHPQPGDMKKRLRTNIVSAAVEDALPVDVCFMMHEPVKCAV